METWYRTGGYNKLIEPVEVIKHTDMTITRKSTWPGGTDRRTNIVSQYDRYHETYTAARTHVIDTARAKVANAQARLNRLKAELETAQLLPEQEGS
jgi:hypothetical protein